MSLELSQLDLVCVAGGFGTALITFWTVEAALSVFTVFLREI